MSECMLLAYFTERHKRHEVSTIKVRTYMYMYTGDRKKWKGRIRVADLSPGRD